MPSSQDQKSPQIKQEDGFFSRIMSKENSPANSSCRVYYGGASGTVPFMWESIPGTPKHPSSEYTLPPLTPPPSYYSIKYNCNPSKSPKDSKSSQLLNSILSRIHQKSSSNVTPSSSWSSSSSSSFSSYGASSLASMGRRRKFHHRRAYSHGSSRSPVCWGIDDEEEEEEKKGFGSSPSSTQCFMFRRRSFSVKKALLSVIDRHGSSGQGVA